MSFFSKESKVMSPNTINKSTLCPPEECSPDIHSSSIQDTEGCTDTMRDDQPHWREPDPDQRLNLSQFKKMCGGDPVYCRNT